MYTKPRVSSPEPLPRGRHKLRREDVRADQRRRIVDAMLESVAEHGYAATSVQRVAAQARVSPNTFYAFFADKLECFLAVCEADADELLARLYAAGAEPDWLSAVRVATRIYLEWWPSRPEASRAFLLELPLAGGDAVQRRNEIQDRFLGLFVASAARAREEQPELAAVPESALKVLVAGMTDLVAGEVRAGRLNDLPRLEDELVDLAVRVIAPA